VARDLRTWLHDLKEPLARIPSLAAKEQVYDDGYFASMDALHREGYAALAARLHELLAPRSAIDLGCGTGTILWELAQRGVDVRGVEGSRRAIERSPVADVIVRANLERRLPPLGRFDVAICIEVAEHLPERAAPQLVESLASLSELVVFSAAPPGQGGTHHVNEQPMSYWLELFAGHGLHRADDVGDELRTALSGAPDYLARNLVYLRA
jgi:2-polyprenyl-3-methyl-5-hydroxy-6-metoxy-1,4-benzoquinol methylase